MIDSFFYEEFFNGGICEFRSIVTSDSPNWEFDKNFYSFNEIYEL